MLQSQIRSLEDSSSCKLDVLMSGHSDELTKLRMNFVERVDSLTGKVTSQHQEVTSLRSQLTLLEMAAAKNVMELQQRLERIFDEMPSNLDQSSASSIITSHDLTVGTL